ncbi:MAG: MYG1 family protein [Leptolyngbyaceae cyanobacterium CSU_1_4]|nr:MYG1 family protein [Leptolyngbyaceae cyanobacterium CSU_1_4]
MSTQPNEELNAEQLAEVSGGEDGGFRNQNPDIEPRKGLLSEPGLSDDELSTVSGGEDGGFRNQNPDIGTTEGLIK